MDSILKQQLNKLAHLPRKWVYFGCVAVVIAIGLIVFYSANFTAPDSQASQENFTVKADMSSDEIPAALKQQGLIKSNLGFRIAFSIKGGGSVQSGVYRIAKSMNVLEVVGILQGEPAMQWVTIPEGLRKEEIADILAPILRWSAEDKQRWISTYTALKYDYIEGVYFPDTYLIPINETPLEVADRLRAHFEEKFALYAKEAISQNIKWTTALTLASIVQREAAGKDDMPLIAGVLWNRLLKGQKLEVDATVQYARGKTDHGWWAPIAPADKQIDSPYNTYLNKGLPPHPISNPGTEAIAAVLNPTETKCLFYLHDRSGSIHCSETYEEHLQNIEKYLK